MKRDSSAAASAGRCPAAGCRFTVTAIRTGVFGDKTQRADVEDTAAANWTPVGRHVGRDIWKRKGGKEEGHCGVDWERYGRRGRKIGRNKE